MSGKYTLELTHDDGSVSDKCNNIAIPDTIEFYVGNISDSIIGIIHSTCELNNGSATVTGIGGSGNYYYQWSTNPVQTSQTATGLGAGKYYVTVSNGNCISVDSVEIFTTPVPVVNIYPKDTSICRGDTIQLTADQGFSNYEWNNGSSGPGITSVFLAGTYYVEVTDSFGCKGFSDTIALEYFPEPVVIISPTDTSICKGDDIILTASGALSFVWFPDNYLSDSVGIFVAAEPKNTITFFAEGTDINGCKSIGKATVNVVETPKILHSDSAYVCAGETIRLNIDNFIAYEWQDGSESAFFNITEPGIYWVKVNHMGCLASDTIIILPCSELWLPNSFTPNGDGKNDVFKAVYSGKIRSFHMMIFNRWGQKIFESNDINKGWNGTSEGKTLPAGTYPWYIIYQPSGNFSTNKLTRSGMVTLLK
jgi:gliding motility-associated-like protein